MQGLHLTADLQGCNPSQLVDHVGIKAHAIACVQAVGLTIVAQQWHPFNALTGVHAGGGVTLTLLLAESHVCLHTWPELGGVTLDVYVCNVSADHSQQAQALMHTLIAWFEPQQVQRHALQRGFN